MSFRQVQLYARPYLPEALLRRSTLPAHIAGCKRHGFGRRSVRPQAGPAKSRLILLDVPRRGAALPLTPGFAGWSRCCSKRLARPMRNNGSASPRNSHQLLPTGRLCRLGVAVLLIFAAALLLRGPGAERLEYPVPLTSAGRYVAVPINPSSEMRRKAGYLARVHELPLVAEPGVADVQIKEFKR